MSTPQLPESPAMAAFEAARHLEEDGSEYWMARDLMKLLGYTKWQNFDGVIDEAKAVCAREGEGAVEKNFRAVTKVSGSRGTKQKDYRLTRHACYLIAMSADGTKLEVATNIFKASLARQMMQQQGVTTKEGAVATHFDAGERVRQTLEDAGLPTPELLATPAKSYQHLIREQKQRLRQTLEDALGLWAQLPDTSDETHEKP